MPHPTGTTARPVAAARTTLLLVLSVLVALLVPGASRAVADGTDAAAGQCAALPLAGFGDPGDGVGSGTVDADQSTCFTVTTEAAGLHRVLLGGLPEGYVQVYDGDTEIDCYDADWGAGWCDLPRAAAYTVKVVNNGWAPADFTVGVFPLGTTDGCGSPVSTAWDTKPVTGSLSGKVALLCQAFEGKPGERITVDLDLPKYGESVNWITDATGAHICPHFNDDDSEGCVLPGDGPYRVIGQITEIEDGYPASYELKVRRLSDPAGCAPAPVDSFGAAPSPAREGVGCRTLTVPADGSYSLYEISDSTRTALSVYDHDGKTVCRGGGETSLCRLTAGTYTLFTDRPTLILDRASTKGCEPAASGTVKGRFDAAGEIDCLTLPFPKDARVAVLKASGADPYPDATVVDAVGAQRCDYETLSGGTCALAGDGPHRVLVSTDSQDPATGPYNLTVLRTDAANDCRAFPAGDFTADGPTAAVRTGDGVFATCLAIPADAHSATENLQLRADTGTTATASFSVLDPDGKQVCSVYASLSTWTTCGLKPKTAYTVLFTGRDTTASYTLARRDVTADAKGCTSAPASAVGGPSVGGDLGAPGTLSCRQVTTADAADVLHLNVRDALGTANILAYKADGSTACSYQNKACAVTGSTRYQVIATVPTNLRSASSYRLDALRIATADGPAKECERVPNVSYGYGPVTGTLNEQHTAVCAVLPTAYADYFETKISDTAGAADTAVPALYNSKLANGCSSAGSGGYRCGVNEPYTSATTPTTLVLGLPEKTSSTAYRAELICRSVFCGTEKVSVAQVTPLTGTSGSKATLKVTGTALHADDEVRIQLNGKTVTARTTEVSADRTSLTAVLDLTGVAPGAWNLSVFPHNGWEYPRGTFTVTAAAAARNTTAPKITGTPKVGEKLTAGPGTWTPAPASLTYQWQADGTPIAGATDATYTVPAALLGKKVTVAVTARLTGAPAATAVSAAVTVAEGSAPHALRNPAVTGSAKVGSVLTVNPGLWSPKPTALRYRWFADGKAVDGATGATLRLTSAQLGKRVSVTVTAVRTGHASRTLRTAATAAVVR
ncbi:hypothetical protein ABT127_34385 [Streptomyces sp. NPDC001904]|uniref:hypothetical protein n=1 Tax=Streptomyces sp. NPDC001904 TaxID=3154531 RepID=UPI00331CC0B4